MKKIASLLLVATIASVSTLAFYHYSGMGNKEIILEKNETTPFIKPVLSEDKTQAGTLDFRHAAKSTTSSVVHIVSTKVSTVQQYNPWGDLFGDDFFKGQQQNPRERRQESSGSGVVISEDGYIVTNNHVVAQASEVEITLHNKEVYTAEVIGTDPSTDLALLKIDSEKLPALSFANSDDVEVGEWVLAVGNPFNLESTVTAGIVSAKGRNINILRDQYSIESFIQTDAAVNPGNSGGALVDLNGNLIGINTAIATPTGVFAGYSFAVPANIVSKVCQDLKNHGVVQRGFLGVSIREVNSKMAEELDLEATRGVYIDKVMEDGAADLYGIEDGDVVTGIDQKEINTVPELQEYIGSKRPGDKMQVTVNRDGKIKSIEVELKNKEGNTEITEKKTLSSIDHLGIVLEDIPEETKRKLSFTKGVKVSEVKDGLLKRNTKIREGFIITKIDDIAFESAEKAYDYLKKKQKGKGMIEGFYPGHPGKVYYGFGLD